MQLQCWQGLEANKMQAEAGMQEQELREGGKCPTICML